MLDIEHAALNDGASVAHSAYEVLKERIVTAVARPGSVISDWHVARELGIGRTPVREALQRLARERLVTIVPRRGAFVSDLQLLELQKISEVRMELEGFCARLAAERATHEDSAVFKGILAREDTAYQHADYTAVIQLDRQLHQAIIRAARNEYLGDCLEPLRNISTRAWYLTFERYGHLAETVSEHHTIVAAIAARDADAADSAMRQHVVSFRNKLRSII
mgnify:CR=1 FL=1